MSNLEKFWEALKILKSDVQATVHGDVTSEDDFNNNIFWVTGENDGTAITTKINPHAEITWAAVKAEMDKL
jgi:predicted phosphodiesterase